MTIEKRKTTVIHALTEGRGGCFNSGGEEGGGLTVEKGRGRIPEKTV